MKRHFILPILLMLLPGSLPAAEEIGFAETYALAVDRSTALEQLIPGTEDYYFYHCLHAQQTGDRAAYEQFMGLWIKRHGYKGRVNQLRTRQALLDYTEKPGDTLEFLRKELKLTFDHRRAAETRKSDAPTRLDPARIAPDALVAEAFRRHKNLAGIEDVGLALLDAANLDPVRRRDLLARLRRPVVPGLPALVVADLNHEHSKGFGSLSAHHVLTLAQLQACAQQLPSLLKQDKYVRAVLGRLQPGDDADRTDLAQQQAHLDRMWTFLAPLDPVHNSLKAHVLYRRLALDRKLGVVDTERFLTYLKLPRAMPYVEPRYLRRKELMPFKVNLNANYQTVTGYSAVGRDVDLVRGFLLDILKDAPDYKAYASYVREEYLKQVFAETKIVHGIGDTEQWASMLSPSMFQALKDRVDIDFSPASPRWLGPEADVQLDVDVKQVDTLLVKIFRLNTFNFYQARGEEIDTAINLDGLVATVERKLEFDESPFLRVRRTLAFPELKERGVYVVELIGNGRSSRALVRKGRMRLLERPTEAGHAFTVLDEENRPVPGAELWIAGRAYRPGAEGDILVPYTSEPSRQSVVIRNGDFCTLSKFMHQAEAYQLSSGFYVDREQLLKEGRAMVVLRPVLTVNSMPVSLSLLEDVRLTVTTTDAFGVSSTTTAAPFELPVDREASHIFKVPEHTRSASFQLDARIRNVSRNKTEDLAASHSLTLNGVDATESVLDAHVSRTATGYMLELLGKNGEPHPDTPVSITLKHRGFKQTVNAALQTDKQGRVALGSLDQIDWMRIQKPDDHKVTWTPVRDRCERRSTLHGAVGEVVRVPVFADPGTDVPDVAALFELRHGMMAYDRGDQVTLKDGFLELRGLVPGDYELLLKEEQTTLRVRITGAASDLGYALSDTRALETMPNPLHIPAVEIGADQVRIKVAYANTFTRVHLIGTRYQPEYDLFGALGFTGFPEPAVQRWVPPESQYLSGRNIGDEFRYILDRRYAKRFPGNMLERPSLLLNPWSLGETEAAEEELALDEALKELSAELADAAARGGRARSLKEEGGSYPNLDFLGRTSLIALNLEPDDQGIVTLDRAAFKGLRQLRILAVDPAFSVLREVALEDNPVVRRDLRLAQALDPGGRLTEQKLITAVPAGDPFSLPADTGAQHEVYGTVASVLRCFSALNDLDTLKEFTFLGDWHQLPEEQKREKAAKVAGHELHVFLAHKDPEFFKRVIQPYLANRRHKTFMDHWLLDEDLSAYLVPERFRRLNAAERALLGRRMAERRAALARSMREQFELIAPDPERYDLLFRTALRSGLLDQSGPAGGWGYAGGVAGGEMLGAFFSGVDAESAADPFGASPSAPIAMPSAAMPAPPATPKGMTAATRLKSVTTRGAMGRMAESMEVAGLADGLMALEGVALEKKAASRYAMFRQARGIERDQQRRLYVPVDKTEEWAESSYYRVRVGDESPDLVPVSAFWKDYAAWDGQGAFLSGQFIEAHHTLQDMLLALAVLDVPFTAELPEPETADGRITIKAATPIIVFHQEIRESAVPENGPQVLVSQNFFRSDDRFRFEGNERFDKFVTEEFLQRVVYGCQVILTNPSSSPLKLQVLVQIPEGAVTVKNGMETRGLPLRLNPFSTQTLEYYFYFPETGAFDHFPVQVARNEEQIARAAAVTFNVVEQLSRIDKEAWPYVSQHGSDGDVLAYLEQHNLGRLDLNQIAFRMKDKAFFGKVLTLLRDRHVYQDTLWSYSVHHNELAAMREYLAFSAIASRCGLWFRSPILEVDPVDARFYQYLEYSPLVHARAHQVGRERKILNHRFRSQYQSTMNVLSYKPELNDEDRLGVTYYLFLQDRITEALAMLGQVDRKQVVEQLPFDYLTAYAAFYTGELDSARQLAEARVEYPVPRWQQRFRNILNQLTESSGEGGAVADEENREQSQDQLAATEPSLELKVEAGRIRVDYRNLEAAELNIYPMDIELLFSRNPFVQQQSAQFSFITPQFRETIVLPEGKAFLEQDLPAAFARQNVMIEVVSGGLRRSQAYYAHRLAVQVIETYGQVKVSHSETRKLLPATYVKVYARFAGGEVGFYKDGYTDLRGRFDYATVNADDGRQVERFAVLVMHDDHGAEIREMEPPKS